MRSRAAGPAGASPKPRPHPFACDAAALRAALARLGAPLPSLGAPDSRLTLTLPSWTRGPQASPQLLRAVEDADAAVGFGGVDVWEVPVLTFAADALLDLALALPPGPVAAVVAGDSLRSWPRWPSWRWSSSRAGGCARGSCVKAMRG